MRKILLTGGAGNIGSALAKRLLQEPETIVTVVDNLSTGDIKKLPKGFDNLKFIKADTNNRSEMTDIMLANQFDFVFHYAAVVGVERTQENPIKVLEDIEGIKNMLQLSKNTGVKRFFYSSSSEVYGEPVTIPQNEETTPLNSRVPYAVVKNVGEAYCRSFQQEYNLDYTVFRFFNTYGPHQTTDFVISKFLVYALKNEPITIYGDGSQSRTFCYVDDNIEATVKALNEDHCVNDVVNIGGAEIISILDLAKLIIEITNSKSEIVFLPPLQDGDMTRRQPDNSKMKEILGRDLIPLEEGIRRMLENKEFMNLMGLG
ncbi:NAD-dependent epimerase/dehydratase family protein [Paracrocinitomix mangrovi]|uniref:NAD-dependent epimerase/dehydratase family protein n=1 Tax=Paracrocinitomix mangrovi TaxID=2862509 RepID=UPI001C8E0B6E|nr:NAD-dependent epimerase/dehydratase family protein [Paracrocinitomix mangrovi]UKN02077.1 NAD-dependent epimerase/dehydratase family protein [Paracrocinitomix mangrovi]